MLFALLLLLPLSISAQIVLPEKDNKIVFEYIDSANATTIMQRAKTWVAGQDDYFFRDISTSENIITGKGSIPVKGINKGFDWYVGFSFSIEAKGSRYRLLMYDFKEQITPTRAMSVYVEPDTKTYDFSDMYTAYKKGETGPDKGTLQSKKSWFKQTERTLQTVKETVGLITIDFKKSMVKNSW